MMISETLQSYEGQVKPHFRINGKVSMSKKDIHKTMPTEVETLEAKIHLGMINNLFKKTGMTTFPLYFKGDYIEIRIEHPEIHYMATITKIVGHEDAYC